MVTHVNIYADDSIVERAREVKDSRGWSWEEFFTQATKQLE